jgi:DNA adenine methylase
LHAKDWKELYEEIPEEILEEAFIYCDPPYENTKQYLFGSDFNYEDFWQWFRECPYSVYVSSYTAPDDIEPINFTHKQVNLDNGNRSDERITTKKKAIENIYWNGKGNAEPTMLDLLFDKGV